jgi:hypothetical protein
MDKLGSDILYAVRAIIEELLGVQVYVPPATNCYKQDKSSCGTVARR